MMSDPPADPASPDSSDSKQALPQPVPVLGESTPLSADEGGRPIGDPQAVSTSPDSSDSKQVSPAPVLVLGGDVPPPEAVDTTASEEVQAVSEETFLKGDQSQKRDSAPDSSARKHLQAATSGYVGGRPASEANFLGQVNSAYVGGTFNFHQATGRQQRGERVQSKYIEKISRVYVPAPFQDQARKVLTGNCVLVLYGSGSVGKLSAALHLLHQRYVHDIFDFSPNVNLDDDQALAIGERQGYVVENLAPTTASNLNASALRRLSSRLQARQSWLIVTVNKSVQIDTKALGDYLIAWEQPQNRDMMLRNHLALYLEDQELRPDAAMLCDEPDVQKALDNRSPAEIDQLAEQLARFVRKEMDTLEQALKPFLENRREWLSDWFGNHERLEERTLMLATAVFHGARYESVVEADKHLHALIKVPPSEQIPPPPSDIFGVTRTAILKEVGARLVCEYEQTVDGAILVERVVLLNPDLQSATIRYTWQEFDKLRPIFLKWLSQFGMRDDWEVNSRAAAAVGELSKCDFSTVFDQVIFPWAKHPNQYARASAALALGILACEDEFAAQIIGRLHEWSKLRNNWRLCWTAALAYGLLAGQRFPIDALHDLHGIAETMDSRLFEVLSGSIVALFEYGYTEFVIHALDAWASDPKAASGAATWLYVFLDIAANVTSRPCGSSRWPTVLWLSTLPAYSAPILRLWRSSLNHKTSRPYALDTLRRWLAAADDSLAIYSALAQFVRALVAESSPFEQDRLRYWLERWGRDRKQPCNSAANICSAAYGGALAKEAQA